MKNGMMYFHINSADHHSTVVPFVQHIQHPQQFSAETAHWRGFQRQYFLSEGSRLNTSENLEILLLKVSRVFCDVCMGFWGMQFDGLSHATVIQNFSGPQKNGVSIETLPRAGLEDTM